nr:MAG TPA: holin [Caudoviricetes sp.]
MRMTSGRKRVILVIKREENKMDFGIGTVVAITVIVYLIGAGCKSVEGLNNKFIPVICGFSGAVLGVVGMLTMPDFPAKDILNAVAIGIVSGLASTGVNQVGKQLTQ